MRVREETAWLSATTPRCPNRARHRGCSSSIPTTGCSCSRRSLPPGRAATPRSGCRRGGGLNPRESFEDAARREVWEETGLESFDLGPCVWTRRSVWRWGERLVESSERYYLARVPPFEVVPMALEQVEIETMGTHRWWSVDEILAARDLVFVPRALGALLAPLLAGDLPREPLVVGL